MAEEHCRLCRSADTAVIFDAPMRSGGVGSDFAEGHKILECGDCGYVFLSPASDDLDQLYESDEFRERFYNEVFVNANREQLDREANQKSQRIGLDAVRGKVVAEYGCGPGVFLDLIKDAAAGTIGVEPTKSFHEILKANGHQCCSYGNDGLIKDGAIDVAVSFDAIEHVLDPTAFLDDIFRALKKGGALYLSMPNHADLLKGVCPEAYNPFNYQLAHLSYFTGPVAESLLGAAGFSDVTEGYLHKYGIDNLLQWAAHGKPGVYDGDLKTDEAFDGAYGSGIERLGISSHLFLTARKT